MNKFKELFKKPITYFVLGALVVTASVLCGVLPLIAKPKPRPALTTAQKQFLQTIAVAESEAPQTTDFSYNTSVLSETQEISEVHYISQNLMVVTITDISNDSSSICSIIASENTTTLTQIASSTEYTFASTDGTNLVLTSKTDSTQALYSISQNQFTQASGVYNSIALLSNGYVLLKQAVTTGNPDYDNYGYYYNLFIAKIAGSNLTIAKTQNNAFDVMSAANIVAINSVQKFSLYFLTEESVIEEFTYDNNAQGQTIQELIEQGFEPLVQDFELQFINQNNYHLYLELLGTEAHHSRIFDYGDGIYYYNIANYLVNSSDCSVTLMQDQANTYSYKTLPNDCYQQTTTTPEGTTTTSYFNAEGKKVWSPSFEIIHSFGDTFIAQTQNGTALYDLNMKVLLDFENTSYFAFYNNLIVYVKDTYGYLADTNGNQIITTGCDQITAEINGRVLFGSYRLVANENEEVDVVWTWNFISTSTLEITEATDINSTYSALSRLQTFYVANDADQYSFISSESSATCNNITFLPSEGFDYTILLWLDNSQFKTFSYNDQVFSVPEIWLDPSEITSNTTATPDFKYAELSLSVRYSNGKTFSSYYTDDVYARVDTETYRTSGKELDGVKIDIDRIALFQVCAGLNYYIYNYRIGVSNGENIGNGSSDKWIVKSEGFNEGNKITTYPHHEYNATTGHDLYYFASYKEVNGKYGNNYTSEMWFNYSFVNETFYYSSSENPNVWKDNFIIWRSKNTWTTATNNTVPLATITLQAVEGNYLLWTNGGVIDGMQIESEGERRYYNLKVIKGVSYYEGLKALGGSGELPTPTREGYTFDGWWNYNFSERITNNDYAIHGALFAKWVPNEYEVTFNLSKPDLAPDDPTCSQTSKTVTFDSAYGDLPTPTCTAYDFAGWWTTADNTGMQVTSSSTVSTASDHTLYAHWTPKSYTITLETPNLTKYGGNNRYPGWGSVYSPSSTNTSKTYTIEDASIDLSNFEPTIIKSGESNRHYIFDHWELISTATGWGDARTGTYPYMNIADAKNVTSFGTPYASNGTVLKAISGNKNAVEYNNSGAATSQTTWQAGKHYGNVTLLAVFKIPIYYLEEGEEEEDITTTTPIIGFRLSNESTSWRGSIIIQNLKGYLISGCNQYFFLNYVADYSATTTSDDKHWVSYLPYDENTYPLWWSDSSTVSYKCNTYDVNKCYLTYTIDNFNNTLKIEPQQTSADGIDATSIGTFDAPVYIKFKYNIVNYKKYESTTVELGENYGKINYTNDLQLLVPISERRDNNVAKYLLKLLNATDNDAYNYEIGVERITEDTIDFSKLGTLNSNTYPNAVTTIKQIQITYTVSGASVSIDAETVDQGALFSSTNAYKKWLNVNANTEPSVYSNTNLASVLFENESGNIISKPVFTIGGKNYSVVAQMGTDYINKTECFKESKTIQIIFSEHTESADSDYLAIRTYKNGATIALHKIKGVTSLVIGKTEGYGDVLCLLVNGSDPYPLPNVIFNEGEFSVCGLMTTNTEIDDFADIIIISEPVDTEISDFSKGFIYVVYQRIGDAPTP